MTAEWITRIPAPRPGYCPIARGTTVSGRVRGKLRNAAYATQLDLRSRRIERDIAIYRARKTDRIPERLTGHTIPRPAPRPYKVAGQAPEAEDGRAQTSIYHRLRQYPPHVVERQWAKYRTVLTWPAPEPEPEPVGHVLPYEHTPGWVTLARGNANVRNARFCQPDHLCPMHQRELSELIATTPPDAKYAHKDVANVTLRDDFASIREEAARHGCAVLSADRPLPPQDIVHLASDGTDYVDGPSLRGGVPTERPDAHTMGLIAKERAMYYAGGPRGARVLPDGTIRLIGYRGTNRRAAQQRFVDHWVESHGWTPTPANIAKYRAQVARLKFAATPVRRSYFNHYLDRWTDADPQQDRRVEREVQQRWIRNHDRNVDCHRPALRTAYIPIGLDIEADETDDYALEAASA
jgi:hypothetical protein